MKALDLFAGTGWGVACQTLGIDEEGVELMPEAAATRAANGMRTIYSDVWEGLRTPELVPDHELLIASPPCQTFSNAGNGAGRKALDSVLALLRARAYTLPGDGLRQVAEQAGLDDRTALVLSPLAYAFRNEPTYIAFEQVPSVLPVWEACAEALRELGYSVATGILRADQFGVSQTRKRAVLVARFDGLEAELPEPTHEPVSMAEVLGWGFTERPAPTFCNSGHGGAGVEWGGNSIRKTMRARSLSGEGWAMKAGVEAGTNDAIRVTVREAAALQSYPADFVWPSSKTKSYLQIGNAVPPLMAEAILRSVTKGA